MTARALFARPIARTVSIAALFIVTACQEPAAPRHDSGPVAVQSVQISGAAWLVEQGSAVYTAAVTSTDGRPLHDRPVTWTSSDTTVATVNGGVVYAVRAGEVTLMAAAGDKSASIRVVVRPLAVDVVEVSALPEVFAGESQFAGVSLRAADGRLLHDRIVTWASLDPAVATVDAAGRVRGIAAGATYLVATSEGRTGSVRVIVKRSRASGRWSITGTALRNANTICSVTNLHVEVAQSGMLLAGEMYYDMWSGEGARIECTPVAGQPGPYTTPATPSGAFSGTIGDNGRAVLTSANGWQLSGMLDRHAGVWSGTLTVVDGDPVNGIVPVRSGSFTATRH